MRLYQNKSLQVQKSWELKKSAYHRNISKTCTSKNELIFYTINSKTLNNSNHDYTESLYKKTVQSQRWNSN